MSLPYNRLPTRDPLDIYTSADINLLQTNIDAVVGDILPANTIKGLNTSVTNIGNALDAEIVARTLADMTFIPLTMFGTSSGVATLTSTGLLTASQIPPITISNTYVVSSTGEMLALDVQVGDVAVRTDINETFILAEYPPTILANWVQILVPPVTVDSVDGRIGYVTLSDLYSPSSAKFILQTSNALIPNAQALNQLSTGMLKSTTSTGLIEIAIPGVDYITGIAGSGDLTASLPIQVTHGNNAVIGIGTSITIGTATTTSTGVVQLTNSYSGSSEVLATTEKAVNDGLATKQNNLIFGNITTSTGLVVSGGTNAVIGSGVSIKPDSGYLIPTTTQRDNWNDAYSKEHVHSNATNLNNINQNLGTSYSPSFAGLTVGTSTGMVKSTSGALSINGTTGSGLSVLNNSPVLITPSTDDITLTSLNHNFTTLGTDTKHYTGVPWDERLKFRISVTYSNPNVVVSLLFNGAYTSFSYYINGKKYTVTDLTPFTNKTVTAAEGLWFVYINKSNVFTVSQTAWTFIDSEIELWFFRFNATANIITNIGEERHTAGRDIFQHARNHSQGAIYRSGFAFYQYNGLTTLSTNTDNNFGRAMAQFTGGSFWDEDILNSIAHSDSAITSTTDTPDTDWNLNVNQFLGFTDLATTSTSSTQIVFTSPHTLITGQAFTCMTGNTTTVRGTGTITTGATGTTFATSSVTGMATGDAIVIAARIPFYYISSTSPYIWRKLYSTSFLGITTQASTWTRSGVDITTTFNSHGLQTDDVIMVTVSSDTGAIPLNRYAVTRTGANTFTFTGVATGGASGTLTYNNAFNPTTIPNGVAQYNNAATGNFSAITSTRFYPVYIIATNLTSEPLVALMGQGQSTNSTLATALTENAFQFQNLLGLSALNIQEIVPIYRLTFQYSSAGGFSNSRIRLVDQTFINIRVSTATGVINNPVVSTLPASSITTDVANFNGILTASETTTQSALDRIDDYAAPKANPVFTGSIIIPIWITGATYSLNQIVINSNIQYICAIGHTAGIFATDLASGDWVAISGGSGSGSGLSEFLLCGA